MITRPLFCASIPFITPASAAASGSSAEPLVTTCGVVPPLDMMIPLPSGDTVDRGSSGSPSWISSITACQISAGRPPPVTPVRGVLSSLPIQTPVTYCSVKPTNHASR